MKHEPFGFFAPQAPPKRVAPAIASPLLLEEFIKTDGEQAELPADPTSELAAKAQADAACWKSASATTDYGRLLSVLFAPGDVRSAVAPLRKSAGPADWDWDAPVCDTLEKRATGTAKQRFERELAEFFRGHDEELAEARAIVDNALSDERAAILADGV